MSGFNLRFDPGLIVQTFSMHKLNQAKVISFVKPEMSDLV